MVSILTSTIRPQYMENVFQNYQQQTYQDKELIIILNHDDMNIDEWKGKAKSHNNVFVYQLPQHKTYGDCLNFAVEKSTHDVLAIFDDDDHYAPSYLTQSMQVMNRSGASVVGKGDFFVYFEINKALAVCRHSRPNTFTTAVAGATLVFKKEICEKVKFAALNLGADKGFKDMCNKLGYKMYATDRYNYTCVRRSDVNDHTWQIDQERFMKSCQFVTYTDDYKLLVSK